MINKIIAGDSKEILSKVKNMEINLVLTSPSYYMDTPQRISKKEEMGTGESKHEYVKLLKGVIGETVRLMAKKGFVVIVYGTYSDHSVRNLSAMIEHELSYVGLMQIGYREYGKNNNEAIMILSNERGKVEIPWLDEIQVYKKVGEFGSLNPDILKWAIKEFTKEEQMVVDPFAGLGSTLKLAKELNRNWFGSEINVDSVKKAKKYLGLYK